MDNLTKTQSDALEKIKAKPQLQSFFFKEAVGLKWFDQIYSLGFFDPSLLVSEETSEQGNIHFKDWPVLIYLERTAPEIILPENQSYVGKFLDIIRNVSKYGIQNNHSNPRTLWYFSKLLKFIPVDKLEASDAQYFEFWMSSPYDNMLTGLELGKIILPRLLENPKSINNGLAEKLLSIFLKVEWVPKTYDISKQEPKLVLDDYWSEKVFINASELIAQKLGIHGLKLIQNTLNEILSTDSYDQTSFIWRPAIEDHEQNKEHEDPANIIVTLYRNVFLNLDSNDMHAQEEYLESLLNSQFFTLKRIAIYVIGVNLEKYRSLLPYVIKKDFFEAVNIHHELFHFLKKAFTTLNKKEKLNVLDLIQITNKGNSDTEANKELQKQQKAYSLLRLLSAINGKGFQPADNLYQEQIQITQDNIPDHPDFHFYSSGAEWLGEASSITYQDILAKSHTELIKYLNEFTTEDNWNSPSKYGLSKELNKAVQAQPEFFLENLDLYLNTELVYLAGIFDGYKEVWRTNKDPEAKKIFSELFEFFELLINQNNFWNRTPAKDNSGFDVGVEWIVRLISEVISSGVTKDSNAFNPKENKRLLKIISLTLENIDGDDFIDFNDAVTLSINTARGNAIEALFDLSLRICRLSDAESDSSHTKVWEEVLKPEFEKIFVQPSSLNNFELYTLFVARWTNILYLNSDWAVSKLPEVFNKENLKVWQVSMQGFSHNHRYEKRLFLFLRENGHLLRALNCPSLPDTVIERTLQFSFIAFLHGDEVLDNPDHILNKVFSDFEEKNISELIWFISTLRDNLQSEKDLEKVFLIWQHILEQVKDGPDAIKIHSKLINLVSYISDLNEPSLKLLFESAPYANIDFNEYVLIKNLKRLVNEYPLEVSEIFLKVLERFAPSQKPEDVLEILRVIKKRLDGSIYKKIKDRYVDFESDFFRRIES